MNIAAKQNKPITTSYAWYALAVLFLINVSNYIDRLSIGPATEHIKRYFTISDTEIGLLASAFTYVYAIISMPMGVMSDRGKRTRFIAAGALFWSVATTVSGFARSFSGFLFARSMVGGGEGIYQPSGSVLIADYFPRRLRATAISIFMSAMLIGGAVSFVVAALILKKTDRFDIPKMAALAPYERGEAVDGWRFDGLSEARDRRAAVSFTHGDETITLLLSNLDEDKPADARTLLFNVDFEAKKGRVTGERAAFARSMVARIARNEDTGLERNTAPLKERPKHFKLPASMRDRFYYDEKARLLVFKGIMTKGEKRLLRKVSDQPEYQTALIDLYNDSRFHYRRSDNWKWIFWIMGPPGLILALLALSLREPVKGGTEEFLEGNEALQSANNKKIGFSELWRTPSAVIMIFSNIFATFCVGGLNTWLFPFVERYKDMESADAALKVGPLVIVAMLLGVVLSGIVADRLFKRTKYAYNIILFTCVMAAIPFLYLFIRSENRTVVIAGVVIGLFFLSWINGPQNTMIYSVIHPRLRATVNAFHILLIHVLGDGPSPTIIGHLSDKFGLQFALMILPAFLVIGGVGFGIAGFFVPRDLKRLEERMKAAA